MSTYANWTEAVRALDGIAGGVSSADLESETLDFKSERGDIKKTLAGLAETAACLANRRGGTVVLGVKDDESGPGAFSGTGLDPLVVRRYVFERVSPPLTVSVDEHMHGDTRLLLIVVPTGADVHGVSGRVSRRLGRSCLPLTPDQIAALHAEREGRDPSQQPSGRSVDELDRTAMYLARRYLGRLTDDRARWAALPDPELCQALGVAAPDGELLVAGEQLFATPQVDFVSYQHRLTAGSPPDASERLAVPLIVAFDRTLELIALRNHRDPLLLPDGQQIELHRYPDDVVREALANALVHRRLDLLDPVQVEHFDDSLFITSMGPLVGGVTVDNILTTASRPRNRLLARAFRSLGLIEELGTGIARMYRSMLRIGKPAPSFDENANSVRVSIVGGHPDRDFARFVALLDAGERDDVEVLLVLRYLCTRSSTRPADVAPILQRTPVESSRVLERMANSPSALIVPTQVSVGGSRIRYRLSDDSAAGLRPAISYRRHTRRDIERQVVAHMREHGRITNQVVRKLFGVGTPRASAILRSLVEQQILVRTSDARRGPGVEYGPGPAMAVQKWFEVWETN